VSKVPLSHGSGSLRSWTRRSASGGPRRAIAIIAALTSKPLTSAPRSVNACVVGPEPHPASRIRCPLTSPSSRRIAGLSYHALKSPSAFATA